MAGLAEFAAQATAGAFTQAFSQAYDPHGQKKAEADLKEQQIIAKKLDIEMKRATQQAQKDQQLLSATKFAPESVQQVTNGLGLKDERGNPIEFQYDKQHYNLTSNLARPGETEARIGGVGGEYKFRTGFYERDAKTGNILNNDDGTMSFIPDGGEIVFKNKAHMQDYVATNVLSAEMRQKLAVAKVNEELHAKKQAVEHKYTTTEQEQRGVIQKDVAKMQGASALAVQKEANKRKGKGVTDPSTKEVTVKGLGGKSIKLNPDEVDAHEKDNEVLSNKIGVALDLTPDIKGDFKNFFSLQEMAHIKQFKNSDKAQKAVEKDRKSAITALKGGKLSREQAIKDLAEKYHEMPKRYIKFLFNDLPEATDPKEEKKGGGFFTGVIGSMFE